MKVIVAKDSMELGKLASKQATEAINKAIAETGNARILLSTGASQFTFFEHFVKEDIDWSKVEMFHLDEYVGISVDHPASFKKYLTERFISKVNPAKYHLIDGQADPEKTIAELTALLNEKQVDVGLIGIGENGHIAFNDPPVADFNDKALVKPVKLDEICRNQQVNDGCFAKIDDVPTHALTLTVPALVKAPYLFCIVPAPTKAWAVKETLTGSIDEHCPASILRRQESAILYLDKDSASLL